MEASTTAANPAAGPLTLVWELLMEPTTIPPIIPAITPESSGAPLAKATPKHKAVQQEIPQYLMVNHFLF